MLSVLHSHFALPYRQTAAITQYRQIDELSKVSDKLVLGIKANPAQKAPWECGSNRSTNFVSQHVKSQFKFKLLSTSIF